MAQPTGRGSSRFLQDVTNYTYSVLWPCCRETEAMGSSAQVLASLCGSSRKEQGLWSVLSYLPLHPTSCLQMPGIVSQQVCFYLLGAWTKCSPVSQFFLLNLFTWLPVHILKQPMCCGFHLESIARVSLGFPFSKPALAVQASLHLCNLHLAALSSAIPPDLAGMNF